MTDRPLIMVVEDDVEMNDLEREFLSVHGMDSVPAYSGSEALEVFDRMQTDAILLDIMLPGIDGFETCRRIRKADGRPMPIIMITALDDDICRRHGQEAGADAYFTKPFNPDEVVQKLRDLLIHSPSHRSSR
jgi:two-component system OmpR family response regulator